MRSCFASFEQRVLAYLMLSCAGLIMLPGSAISQVGRQVVIGDLLGRTDVRNLKVLTSHGLFPVTTEGNGKPFSVFTRSDNRVVLRYHETENSDKVRPNTLIYKFYDTERALITALILEEVDVALLESEESALEVSRSNRHFLPYPLPMQPNTAKLIIYNHQSAPLDNVQIRSAISYGINHDYLIKKILGGKASIARGPFDDSSELYVSGLKSYKYNPRLALRILAEEGWHDSDRDGILDKNGSRLTLTLYYQKGLRIDETISRNIKINLIKLGIDVQPRPLSKRDLNDKLHTGDFQAVLTDHVFMESMESLYEFFAAKGQQNFARYRSRTLENYFRFYAETEEPQGRKTLIQSVQNVVNQDQPITFLYFKWLTHFVVNVEKFDNFRHTEGPGRGDVRPFEEWVFRKLEF